MSKVTAETITNEQIESIVDTGGDGDPDFWIRVCRRAMLTPQSVTDDEIESFVKCRMAEEPERRVHWLGMGDEAMAHPDVGAPYREHCRRTIVDAMRKPARERCAAAWNASHGGDS